MFQTWKRQFIFSKHWFLLPKDSHQTLQNALCIIYFSFFFVTLQRFKKYNSSNPNKLVLTILLTLQKQLHTRMWAYPLHALPNLTPGCWMFKICFTSDSAIRNVLTGVHFYIVQQSEKLKHQRSAIIFLFIFYSITILSSLLLSLHRVDVHLLSWGAIIGTEKLTVSVQKWVPPVPQFLIVQD